MFIDEKFIFENFFLYFFIFNVRINFLMYLKKDKRIKIKEQFKKINTIEIVI